MFIGVSLWDWSAHHVTLQRRQYKSNGIPSASAFQASSLSIQDDRILAVIILKLKKRNLKTVMVLKNEKYDAEI